MTTRKAKSTPNMQRQETVTIGLDIGFGNVKAVYGDKKIVFPSVAAHAHTLKFQEDEISSKYPGDQLTDSDGDWFIGDLAVKHAPTEQQIMLQGRTSNEDFNMAFRVRMMCAAISKLMQFQNGDVIHIQIATGLPVNHMGDAPALKAALVGRHKIDTNNASFVANVISCVVMPQPYGTIYSQMMTESGDLNPFHTAQRTAVVDVGRFTIDCTLDDDGEYVDADSDTLEAGVFTAQERISAIYEKEFRKKPSHAQIEKLLRTGGVRVNGEPVDYTEYVQEALKPLRDGVKSLMGKLWGTAGDIDLILLSGGGVGLVDADTYQAYSQARVVDDPQFANAIGYLHYARFLAKNA